MSDVAWKKYRKVTTQEMRPYIVGEGMCGIAIRDAETPPVLGGQIARDPLDHNNQWYIPPEMFMLNFVEAT